MTHCPKCDTPIEEGTRFCANCGENLLEASSASEDAYIGRNIGGGFLVQELIGIGAMGRVYKAEQLSLGKSVAIKILHRHLLGDPSLEKRFQREARAAAKLQHPNCISVIDFGKGDDGSLYIAMEYLEGPNLGQILQEGPMPWPRAVHILSQVASGLDEAHCQGIIHRDLKPENIVLEQRRNEVDFVKVLDFGIAKVQENDNREGVLTMVGAVCGTPEYMAPEQARGDANLDARADIYAMGCILYQMLCGELPFSGDSVLAVITKQLSEIPIPPTERAPDVDIPQALERLALKALSKDPDDRPASALVFGQDLMSIASTLESGPFEARTSSQVPDIPEFDGDEMTLPPEFRKSSGVMLDNALSTSDAIVASVAPPAALVEADRRARAQTPSNHLANEGDTLAMESEVERPIDESRIETHKTGDIIAADDAGPAVAPPIAPRSEDTAKTSPSSPLHPTPLIAGEVMETGPTDLMALGSAGLRKLAIAASVGLVVVGGAIWAVSDGDDEVIKAKVVSASSTTSTPTAPVVAEPVAPPPAIVEAPSAPETPRASAAAVKRAKPKKKRRKKRAKSAVAKSAAAKAAPAGQPAKAKSKAKSKPEPPKKSKMSKAKVLFTKASKSFGSGEYHEAIGMFREAMVAGYRKPDIHYQLGRAYMRLSKPEQARRHFQTYLKKYPDTPKRKLVEAILRRGK